MIEKIDRFARFQNECADLFIDVAIKHQTQDGKFIAICGDQFNFIAGRSNAILELIKCDALWDAQILARPVLESLVKLSFICYSPKSQRSELCSEYETALAAINVLNLHNKASKTLSCMGSEARHPTLSKLILPDEELLRLRTLYPKELKNKIESRWGFTQMILSIDKNIKDAMGLQVYSSFLHTYGLSSHLIHADETGLGAIRSRNELSGEKYESVIDSHRFALLDVVAGSSMFAAIALSWATSIRIHDAMKLTETYERVHSGSY